MKPLVLLTPKYLLHHRPATSALADFTVGTFFNRVIDDGKVYLLLLITESHQSSTLSSEGGCSNDCPCGQCSHSFENAQRTARTCNVRARDYKSAQCDPHVQASDNTRHRSVNPSTGEPFLLPACDIRRVVLCTGQVYYHLSRPRRARRIRDIVLVRLEQIAPFPSDLLIKVCSICRRFQSRGCFALFSSAPKRAAEVLL